MFLKEHITCKGLRILALTALLAGCAFILDEEYLENASAGFVNTFTVAPQVSPPRNIQSIQLYREGSPSNPPVIRLGGNERLILEFDYLDSMAKQFTIQIRHYSGSWEASPLNPEFYIDGFYEDYFGGGEKSFVQRPSYRHFEYTFPNQQFSINTSGNYLLSIFDAGTNELLFALPLFVSEDEGGIRTRVEKLFTRREDLREEDRLFSEYRYPEFVELPQFDLTFIYVQNRFWGRAREVRFFDTSSPGLVNFHLSQDEAFLGDYEFNTLDIRSLSVTGRRILSYEPENIPPKLILRRDVQNLSPVPAFSPGPRFGLPIDDRNAQYANVQFQLETGAGPDSLQKIYLVGDFNRWSVNELNRMEFDSTTHLWQGNAFIKQGEYAYKYVVLEGNRIDDLALDQSYTFSRQEYFAFVYFRDPARHYDRLLKVDHIPK